MVAKTGLTVYYIEYFLFVKEALSAITAQANIQNGRINKFPHSGKMNYFPDYITVLTIMHLIEGINLSRHNVLMCMFLFFLFIVKSLREM